ncbi:hypothetical protein BKA70DRAFT_1395944 [Coprinopsis sp. MPI-PUGE-AT-0042]|nr:hypothetical protein BKA70DRAFT_1395944 [Coprinopsis sp. MPI-PUGE-AT-0042]
MGKSGEEGRAWDGERREQLPTPPHPANRKRTRIWERSDLFRILVVARAPIITSTAATVAQHDARIPRSYEQTIYVEGLLEKTGDTAGLDHPSPSRMLVLNNGSKFLYHPTKSRRLSYWMTSELTKYFLGLSDDAAVLFDDGCMAVELLDYREKRSKHPQPEKQDRT